MIRAIIIDDEQNTRDVLGKLLQDYHPEIKLEGSFSAIEAGMEAVNKLQPDLVFLDIEFPESTGFDLLEEFPDFDFDVIFISGHEEYALKAFKTEAVDYLLKPFDLEDLSRAIKKVVDKRKKAQSAKHSEVFLQAWKGAQDQQIALSSSEGFLFVKIKDIIYCRGDGAYTYFYMKNTDRITVSKNLKEFETLLSDFGFFRVHKSFLINLNEMKKYIRGEGGYLVMSNNDTVDVSKRRKEAFMANLSKI